MDGTSSLEAQMGLVFGFQNAKLFYLVMWEKSNSHTGLVIKVGKERGKFLSVETAKSIARNRDETSQARAHAFTTTSFNIARV